MEHYNRNPEFSQLNSQFSGPVLFRYVWWVLWEARKREIKTLYFLARDGYLLREIALQFCQTFQLPITCKYLYCSRASLRMPSYHLIGTEAHELLTLGGYHVTLHSMMDRLNLSRPQRKEVYREIGLSDADEDRLLYRGQLEHVRPLLAKSPTYQQLIREKSLEAYPSTMAYLRQEGLFQEEQVAIVDSGWTGSMQRSLRQLLQSGGFTGELMGFYFGMYARPKEAADGSYLTWFFSKDQHKQNKIPFCNNLFECILSAPHGMTVGYQESEGRYEPVLAPGHPKLQLEQIQQQIEEVLEYTRSQLLTCRFTDLDMERERYRTLQLVKRYMAHPKPEEVAVYGAFLFCDDVTEGYHKKLAGSEQQNTLRGYTIPARIVRRCFQKGGSPPVSELFWPYGTIAFLPGWKRWWYRMNVSIWEWIRCVLR